jgi:hypothetical protein
MHFWRTGHEKCSAFDGASLSVQLLAMRAGKRMVLILIKFCFAGFELYAHAAAAPSVIGSGQRSSGPQQ